MGRVLPIQVRPRPGWPLQHAHHADVAPHLVRDVEHVLCAETTRAPPPADAVRSSGRQVCCSHLRATPPCVGADHSEHHLYTTIPFHALPRAHGLLKDHIVNVSEGHIEVHRQVLSTWMKEQREALVGAAAKKPKAA